VCPLFSERIATGTELSRPPRQQMLTLVNRIGQVKAVQEIRQICLAQQLGYRVSDGI